MGWDAPGCGPVQPVAEPALPLAQPQALGPGGSFRSGAVLAGHSFAHLAPGLSGNRMQSDWCHVDVLVRWERARRTNCLTALRSSSAAGMDRCLSSAILISSCWGPWVRPESPLAAIDLGHERAIYRKPPCALRVEHRVLIWGVLGAPAKFGRQLGRDKVTGYRAEDLGCGEPWADQAPGPPAHGEVQHQVGVSAALVAVDDLGVFRCSGQVQLETPAQPAGCRATWRVTMLNSSP